jgi:hypothetical protein
MRYRLTIQDGHRYEGTSKVYTLTDVGYRRMRIAVSFDAADPATSRWRNAQNH